MKHGQAKDNVVLPSAADRGEYPKPVCDGKPFAEGDESSREERPEPAIDPYHTSRPRQSGLTAKKTFGAAYVQNIPPFEFPAPIADHRPFFLSITLLAWLQDALK
jgi:hypothetical protein